MTKIFLLCTAFLVKTIVRKGPESLAGGNSNEKRTGFHFLKLNCIEPTFDNTCSPPSPLLANTVAGSFQMGKILNRWKFLAKPYHKYSWWRHSPRCFCSINGWWISLLSHCFLYWVLTLIFLLKTTSPLLFLPPFALAHISAFLRS